MLKEVPKHHHLLISGSAGQLQSIYHQLDHPVAAVVICHPHPQYGGTMRNKVVYWMARAFEERACAVLRFNFRGVEQSEGQWSGGEGEADDAASALGWMQQKHATIPLWIAGFSFGCYAGLKAARHNPNVTRMFAIAPAVGHADFSFMQGETRPLTVVQGQADEIVPPESVTRWTKTLPCAHLHRIEQASHFFPEHMQSMTKAMLAE